MLNSFLFALKPTGGSLPVIMLALTCEIEYCSSKR